MRTLGLGRGKGAFDTGGWVHTRTQASKTDGAPKTVWRGDTCWTDLPVGW